MVLNLSQEKNNFSAKLTIALVSIEAHRNGAAHLGILRT
jgi:hypothetical protein